MLHSKEIKLRRAQGNLAPWYDHERHAREQARRDAEYPELYRQWKAHLEQLESLVPDWRALTFD